MSEYVLETNNLTKTYGRKNALSDVSLRIRKSDIYGFIGRNGAGKTTAIKLIAGLTKPTSGEIKLFEDLNLSEGRKKIGVVIENPAFYPYMTARQNIEVQRIMKGIEDATITDELLKVVGLSEAENKKAKNFSLGMKQRLGIALALVGDPEFLILDEPINGLDPTGIREIRELIIKLNQEAGITVLISSHILGELSKMCTAYGVINEGKLVAQMTSDELKSQVRSFTKLTVNNPDRAIEILNNELDILDLKVDKNIIYIYDSVDRSGEVNSVLAKNDIIVESISKEEGSYEDYFIKLMQEGKESA